MHFGKKLLSARHEPWIPYYLDYKQLKGLLEEEQLQDAAAAAAEGVLSPSSSDEMMMLMPSTAPPARLSRIGSSSSFVQMVVQSPVTLRFLPLLERQIEKTGLFFLREQGHVAHELSQLREEQELLAQQQQQTNSEQKQGDCMMYSAQDRHQQLQESYRDAAVHLLKLVQFVDLNLTGIRKILKKHDRIVPNSRLSQHYLMLGDQHHQSGIRSSWSGEDSLTSSQHQLQALLQCDGSLLALQKTLETGLDELRWSINPDGTNNDDDNSNGHLSASSNSGAGLDSKWRHSSPKLQLAVYQGSLVDLESAGQQELPLARVGLKARCSSHQNFDPATSQNLRSSIESSELILYQIQAARKRLQQSADFTSYLAARMMVVEEEHPGAYQQMDGLETIKLPSRFSNFLNLLSTFLYMTNYYIVAPTSGRYASQLGGNVALASMIIGMTPVAALVSTILYSWWTCYSYKPAMIFASTCCMVGNLLYGAGLPMDSLTIVMVGRLLNGFGSVRSINRRYIADAIIEEERTAASATFVAAGALGMAAGPAIASLLHLAVPRDCKSAYWQVENAPGWFMFTAWAIYLVFLILYFEDPPRKREEAVDAGNVQQGNAHARPLLDNMPKTMDTNGGGGDERQPLLGRSESGESAGGNYTAVRRQEGSSRRTVTTDENSSSDGASPPIWRNVPVLTTFLLYFVLKLILEAILSSSSLLTHYYFGWSGGASGLFLAALGLLMFPVNVVVAYMSRTYEDRDLMAGMQVFMFLGCVGMLQYGGAEHYHVLQYIIASILAFSSATSLEGPNMSLLSKTLPPSWRRGFWNMGLLATEWGTLGRAVADVFLTICGSSGLHELVNRAFGTLSGVSFFTLSVTLYFFSHLVSTEKEDF